jgi:4-amino-4-deoxy-L-arabinose transferase-like glycosyltransferase
LSDRAVIGVVAALALIGLLVRLPSFGDSLFGDELSTYFIVTGSSFGHVLYLLEGGHSIDLNPPLYFLVAWLSERLGHSPELLRLPSLLAGVATIPLTYVVGARTVGRPAAIVGAALVALSPFLIFFSTEARPFALLVALCLLSTLSLLRAIETGRIAWWVAYAAFSCAAMYASYTAVFLLAGQFLWAAWSQAEARLRLVLANAAAAIAYAPWLPAVIKDSGSRGVKAFDILSPFSLNAIKVDLGRWSIGQPFTDLKTVPGTIALSLAGAGILLGLLGLGFRAISRSRGSDRVGPPSTGLALVLVLAISTPLGEALYSWLGPHSVWDNRQLLASTPGLALAAGALLTGAGERIRYVASALVIAAFALGAVRMQRDEVRRPNYAGVAGFIDGARKPGDVVLDLPLPTPGPLTNLEAALGNQGIPPSPSFPVLRAGIPSRRAMLHARPYASLPTPPIHSVIQRAERKARGHSLFVVVGQPHAAASTFVPGLLNPRAARLRLVAERSFPGLFPVSVFQYRQRGRS